VLTNTITPANVEELRVRGVSVLVTSTPSLGGRSFGTNVMEAALLALLGKQWKDVSAADYMEVLHQLDFKPRVERLDAVKSTRS